MLMVFISSDAESGWCLGYARGCHRNQDWHRKQDWHRNQDTDKRRLFLFDRLFVSGQ